MLFYYLGREVCVGDFMKLILRLIFIISIISLGTACEEEDGLSSKVDIRINGKPRVFTNTEKNS